MELNKIPTSTPSRFLTGILIVCVFISLVTFDLYHNHPHRLCTEVSLYESHDGHCPVCQLAASFKAVDIQPDPVCESEPVIILEYLPFSSISLTATYEPQSERAPPTIV